MAFNTPLHGILIFGYIPEDVLAQLSKIGKPNKEALTIHLEAVVLVSKTGQQKLLLSAYRQ